jgi:hypothetical protein
MMIDYNLQFIEKKLSEAKTAVMHIDGNNVVKLPNDVVTFLKVDETGKLWFAAHRPRCGLRVYEQSFPLRLFFYRKGIGFYIETSGIATIAGMDDSASVDDQLEGGYLIKMTPQFVEYTEIGRKQYTSISQWWSSFTRWVNDSFSFIHTKHLPLSGIQKSKNYG